MWQYYTMEFGSSFIEEIADWLNSFYDPDLTNSQQSIEVISYTVINQTVGHVSDLKSILVTIKVFKAK